MKVHVLTQEHCNGINLYETFHPEIGDIEIWDDGDIYVVLDSDYYRDSSGPEFGGEIATADNDLAFEEIRDYVKVIKRTKIAEKLYKNNIWKENKEWLIVKK